MSYGSDENGLRRVARGLTPPYLWRALEWTRDFRIRARSKRSGESPPVAPKADWEYVPEGWMRQNSDPAIKGWNVAAIADTYRSKWPSFVRAVAGPGPLGVAHDVPADIEVPRDERGAHHTIMTFAYALTLASRTRIACRCSTGVEVLATTTCSAGRFCPALSSNTTVKTCRTL